SLWTIADSMYVGFEGSGGSLVISNGAKLSCTEGFVGTNPGSDTNNALVTGAGSVWTNSADMYVGYIGVKNSLLISNGGRVYSANGNLADDSTSSNNTAVVTGSGSFWTNSGNMYVGYSGVGNSLVISNGASVYDQWGVIGEDATASNNAVRVESGGIWRNQRIVVGDNGSHNALDVNGGTVLSTQMVVGNNAAYCDSLAELDSGTIIVTNSTHDAVLEVYGGTLLLTGGTVTVDTLRVTNPCAQVKVLGGTLTYRSLVLNPNADADGDGIPNAWEQARGLNPLNPLDAASDNDGDGMSNLQEYLAGTNPTNSASSFRITSAVRTGNDIRLNWKAVGGKSYVLQKSGSPTGGFTDLSPVITIPGAAETVTNFLHAGAATNWPPCYYRVRLGP
ncbi:MAG TPA: hypothetical protein VLT36_06850, partial [Candidatus Dormibacteraeota bacterium]|nr:hypothetical protein [Candidatus Dormibacteraeota bacterium]